MFGFINMKIKITFSVQIPYMVLLIFFLVIHNFGSLPFQKLTILKELRTYSIDQIENKQEGQCFSKSQSKVIGRILRKKYKYSSHISNKICTSIMNLFPFLMCTTTKCKKTGFLKKSLHEIFFDN